MVLGLLTSAAASTITTTMSNPLAAAASYIAFYVFGDYHSTRFAIRHGQTENNPKVRKLLKRGGWDAFWEKKLKLSAGIGLLALGMEIFLQPGLGTLLVGVGGGLGLLITALNVSSVYIRGNADNEPTYPYSEAP